MSPGRNYLITELQTDTERVVRLARLAVNARTQGKTMLFEQAFTDMMLAVNRQHATSLALLAFDAMTARAA